MSQERDAVQSLICDEVARAGPIDEARSALELIVESSLRWSRGEDGLLVTVVDESGEPRHMLHGGQETAFSVRDLVAELRTQHPGLFRPGVTPGDAQEQGGLPDQTGDARRREEAPVAGSAAHERQAPRLAEPVERDIWHVGSDSIEDEFDEEEALERTGLAELGRRMAGHAIRRLSIMRGAAYRRFVSPDGTSGQRPPSTTSGSEDPRAGANQIVDPFDEDAPRGWRRPGLVVPACALGLLVAAALVATAFLPDDEEAPPAMEVAARTALKAPPAQQPPGPAAPIAGGEGAVQGVPEVLDTAALFLDGHVVRLFGVQWAKGAGNPELLTQYLAGREVSCIPAGPGDVYHCTVEGRDLSTVVLYNGGGRTTEAATPDLRRAEEHAKRMRVGLWSQPVDR